MFVHDNNITELFMKCNKHVHDLNEWFLANKLSLNVSKTCYTLFDPHVKRGTLNSTLKLFIDGAEIQQVNCCKYLGVFIDDHLSWSDHISYVYKKIVKFTGIFYKIRNKMPNDCLKNVYYALVYPHLLYGIELYANTNKCNLDKLIILNNKILRILQRKSLHTNVISL